MSDAFRVGLMANHYDCVVRADDLERGDVINSLHGPMMVDFVVRHYNGKIEIFARDADRKLYCGPAWPSLLVPRCRSMFMRTL